MYYEFQVYDVCYTMETLKAIQLKAINIICDHLDGLVKYNRYDSYQKYLDTFVAIQNKNYKLAIKCYNEQQFDKRDMIIIKKISKPQIKSKTSKVFKNLIKEQIFK